MSKLTYRCLTAIIHSSQQGPLKKTCCNLLSAAYLELCYVSVIVHYPLMMSVFGNIWTESPICLWIIH